MNSLRCKSTLQSFFKIESLLFLLFLFGCKEYSSEESFIGLKPSKSGVYFNNEIIETDSLNPVDNLYVYNGAGVGIGDINNDGLPDIFFAGNAVSSRLYLNQGDLSFRDITEEAGLTTTRWCTGVSMVDINSDGLLDIYVSVGHKENGEYGENLLFINKGNNTFEELGREYGLNDDGYTTQAVFFDYDKDGDLDVYLLTNGMDGNNNLHPIRRNSEAISTDRLYRNNGNLTFTDVSVDANITIEGYGLGVGIIDANNDGWPDIYCSNDFISNDLLWINQKDGTFKEGISDYINQTSHTGMGLDIADFNNDGYMDIIQVDMLPDSISRQKTMIPSMNYNRRKLEQHLGFMPQYIRNTLQLNTGLNRFSEIGRLSEIHKTDWSWAPLFLDMDNDGLKDLFISNGYGKDVTDLDFINYINNPFGTPESQKSKTFKKMLDLREVLQTNYFFKNSGNLIFNNINTNIIDNKPSISNGSAYADLDLDGDLDLVVSNINSIATIYVNQSRNRYIKNNFLRIQLHGPPHNTYGIGTRVSLYYNQESQYLEQYPVRGYKSSVEPVLHFGLGSHKVIDSLVIDWPDGRIQVLKNVIPNKVLNANYINAEQRHRTILKSKSDVSFEKVDEIFDLLIHSENDYIDFENQPLLMKMLSREGPDILVGDVNNDNLDDIILGSAYKDTTFVWFQTKEGTLRKGNFLPESWEYEDQGMCFLDLNSDGALDLIIGSGGNEFQTQKFPSFYLDRVYMNDGKGNFLLNKEANPNILNNTRTLSSCDYDKDGDIDLFVGSGNKPLSYPNTDESYILKNEDGKFKKVVPIGFEELGLVTASLWTDFNNDGWVDLIVVGEWMSIKFFENDCGELRYLKDSSGIDNYKGLWQSITPIDFDLDGDEDYIVGNHGLNSILKANLDHPIKLLAGDFDDNGIVDPILGIYSNGNYHTYHSRDAIKIQIPFLGKRFRTYASFSKTSLENIFTDNERRKANELTVNHLQSSLIENLGNGKFKISDLPIEAQISPVSDIYVDYFDDDDYPDFILVGNRDDNELVGGSQNSSLGQLFLGNGLGGFKPISADKTGLCEPYNTRKIAKMKLKDEMIYLITVNNRAISAYRKKSK